MMRTWTTAVRPVLLGAMEANPALAPALATTRSVSLQPLPGALGGPQMDIESERFCGGTDEELLISSN